MARRTATWLLTGWLIACGGSLSDDTGKGDRTGGGSSGSSIQNEDLSRVCRSFFRAHQAWFVKCGPGYGSAPETENVYVASCASLFTLPGVAATVADIDACTAQVSSDDDCNAPPACVGGRWPMYVPAVDRPGTLALGAACVGAVQCASGECSWEVTQGSCGVCVERGSEGQSCDTVTRLCREGLTCLDAVCGVPAAKPGQKCVRYGSSACPFGLFCDAPAEGQQGTCQLRPGPGQPCGAISGFACREDLYCLDGLCVDGVPPGGSCDAKHACQSGFFCHEGLCRTPRYDIPLGGDCSFDQCAVGLFCSPDVACQMAQSVAEGDDCSFDKVCGEGLACSRGYLPGDPAGRCVKAPAAGGPCVDLECGSLAQCLEPQLSDGNPGHCVALGGIGQGCPCVAPLACVHGVCQPPGSVHCP